MNSEGFAAIARAAVVFFEAERGRERRLPFVHGFPKNCCEVASTFLAGALSREFPDAEVEVVTAYKPDTSEWHFWVELDAQVLDVTAHQFSGFEGILVCARPSPLERQFPEVNRSPGLYPVQFPGVSETAAESVIAELCASIHGSLRIV